MALKTIHRCCVWSLLSLLLPLALFIASCGFNPFIPPTGQPLPVKNTPSSVISQLLRSYETRSISSFEEILPADTSFRFYVSPSFFTGYQTNPSGILLYEKIDTGYFYVPQGDYHYWGRDEEVKSHQNLFDRTYSISFTTQPIVNPSEFKFHYDSLGDTIGVEVQMKEGSFDVMYKQSESDFFYLLQPVDIQQQVFYLIRNSDGWVISKWFDLGTAPNTN